MLDPVFLAAIHFPNLQAVVSYGEVLSELVQAKCRTQVVGVGSCETGATFL